MWLKFDPYHIIIENNRGSDGFMRCHDSAHKNLVEHPAHDNHSTYLTAHLSQYYYKKRGEQRGKSAQIRSEQVSYTYSDTGDYAAKICGHVSAPNSRFQHPRKSSAPEQLPTARDTRAA